MSTRRKLFIFLTTASALLSGLFSCTTLNKLNEKTPNILFIIADDWSYPHAGFYGYEAVNTPNFDRIAKEGVSFDNAFVASPSCTPSRAAILTGQSIWRLKEGANLYGPLRPEIPVYTDLLERAGYLVGFTKKGWGPGESLGRARNPAGDKFDSFNDFLKQRKKATPFCFWFGSYNPHRGYKQNSGLEAGISAGSIELPKCFPDSPEIRRDMADYLKEVQDFDNEIGELLAQLESTGELDNTVIVVTSDNGMPFPRCKSNLYDLGTRVPMAIRWGNGIKKSVRSKKLVSLTDLAPTFLDIAQVKVPNIMTGKSLLPILLTAEENSEREYVLFGKERHVPGQELGNWSGYPSRAIRTSEFLYINNLQSDNWPAGTPNYHKASLYPGFYSDVDGGPTKSYMIDRKDQNDVNQNLFQLSFGKRQNEELYAINNDPDQLINLANDQSFFEIKSELKSKLMDQLKESNDPRIVGGGEVFEDYPYTGGTVGPTNFKRSSSNYSTVLIEDIPSRYIGSRTVEVLMPTRIHHDQSFPVLYVFDGQVIFHSFQDGGLINRGWQIDEVVDSLSNIASIPKLIVVGIFNGGAQRFLEYMPEKPASLVNEKINTSAIDRVEVIRKNGLQSDRQLQFIVEELKPYIDSNFKTIKDREHTFIAGSSMGGLISAYAISEYPDVFGGAICISTHWPALDGVFIEYLKDKLPDPLTHKIYFDYGTVGLDSQYEPFQMKVDGAMKIRGYELNKNWLTKRYEGAAHENEDWHARLHIPLEFMFSQN